jgi:hypothetical protein
MAGSPQWKLYTASGRYMASAKEPECLAACIGLYGHGATIRHGHSLICWTEGVDGYGFNSYDACSLKCQERVQEKEQAEAAKRADYLRRHPVPIRRGPTDAQINEAVRQVAKDLGGTVTFVNPVTA